MEIVKKEGKDNKSGDYFFLFWSMDKLII